MIKANELRIGNWVKLGKENTTVFQILYNREKGHCINKTDYEEDLFDPIPLTPEILEKCGFSGKYKSCGYNYTKGIITITSQDEDDLGNPIPNYTLHFYHNYEGQPLYFLHQIQNLYFAKTGEELKINLEP